MYNFIKTYRNSLLWCVAIALLCFMPGNGYPRMFIPHLDKVVHFGLWGVLATLVVSESNPLRVQGSVTRRAQRLGLIWPTVYGVVVELVQGIPQVARGASLFDWIADVAGVVAAVLCYRMLNHIFRGLV